MNDKFTTTYTEELYFLTTPTMNTVFALIKELLPHLI